MIVCFINVWLDILIKYVAREQVSEFLSVHCMRKVLRKSKKVSRLPSYHFHSINPV